MNRIVCTIFFIVRCFGQQPPLNNGTAVVPPSPPVLKTVPALSQVLNLIPANVVTQLPSLLQLPNFLPPLPSIPIELPSLPPLPNVVPPLPQLPNVDPPLPPLPNIAPTLNSLLNRIAANVTQLPSQIPNINPAPPPVPNPSGSLQSRDGVPNLPLVSNSVPGLPQSLNGIPAPSEVPSAPDFFERPCPPIDLDCIRGYFLDHSNCWPAHGRVPDPLPRAISISTFYPSVNMSQFEPYAEYTGFNNGRIQEFYINRDTDKLVIGIELRDIQKSSNDTSFRYHRRGKEPIITHGFSSALFSSVYVTAIIPHVDDLQLDMSESFAYSNELPTVVLDPTLGQSSDPSVPVMFAAFQANLPTEVTEFLFTEGPFMAATYIQDVICDFGLEIY